jgi:hypothetical protein
MARREAINEVRPVLEELDKVGDALDKGLDAVEKGVDVAAEAVGSGTHVVIEEAHAAAGWVRNPKVAAGIVIVTTSVAVGFTTWKLAKRHFTKKYEEELERELESARKFFGRLNKVDEDGAVLTPEDLVKEKGLEEEAATALKDYQEGPTQYDKVTPASEVVEAAEAAVPTTSNVFLNGKPLDPAAFDLEEELKHRSIEAPYVITRDEFFGNESGYVQLAITYFAGDDTLVDQQDQPMEEVESTVGIDNLARFGHGSGDKNVVYIRNDRTEAEYEISYSPGEFAVEAGFIQHSDGPVARRYRPGADE